MMHSVERSLKRLQTDYVDLLYLHMWDFMTPVEEILRGLDDLIRQGKVNYIGLSDTLAWISAEAHTRAELRAGPTLLVCNYPTPYAIALSSAPNSPWQNIGKDRQPAKFSGSRVRQKAQ